MSSDASSCSTKSTGACSSTLPLPNMHNNTSTTNFSNNCTISPRVIANPLVERFNPQAHGVGGGSGANESIYCTVLDTASEDGGDMDPTYQTVYLDETLYIDRNLDLIKAKPRFR